ncbi:MAG: DNA-binding protein [Clostridia bacterium]|nr:DNA-binding protein [Clostridia bacterium]MBR3681101.1 DNA-binding protein [Clostridia bacterium]
MFEKNMGISYLLDFYGEVLDGHTHEVMTAYYDDDLSLSEVASLVGISRQGVRHIIKKGEEQLTFLEEKLGLAAYHTTLSGIAERLDGVIGLLRSEDADTGRAVTEIEAVRDILREAK